MKYSIIVPVYNRPNEIKELLDSILNQRFRNFEVVVVEDGSMQKCEDVVLSFQDVLDVKYFYKPNSGPGPSRNYGAERASGDFLIILDSDVIIPDGYFEAVEYGVDVLGVDAFGGPDRAHESFTTMQKAINYSMTSFFTTGGIRGGSNNDENSDEQTPRMDKFYPRSYNLGIRRSVFEALGGFAPMRFGEDIDLSIRIYENGYKCCLLPKAWVYHKRRTDLRKFFKQVYNFGIARINLYKKYPKSLKLVHLMPSVFTVGVFLLLLCSLICVYSLLPLVFYSVLVFLDSSIRNKSVKIGLYSIATSYVQLMGYGLGFLKAWWARCVMGKGEQQAFRKNFYK